MTPILNFGWRKAKNRSFSLRLVRSSLVLAALWEQGISGVSQEYWQRKAITEVRLCSTSRGYCCCSCGQCLLSWWNMPLVALQKIRLFYPTGNSWEIILSGSVVGLWSRPPTIPLSLAGAYTISAFLSYSRNYRPQKERVWKSSTNSHWQVIQF
ncbi:hypothetical protein X801_02940, partial [Opisthorchis viverrini]